MKRSHDAFTLAELLVSIAVLTLLVLVVSRMLNSATNITILGSSRMDTESQVRPFFDRLGVDLSQMIKRADADYYVKSSLDPENGNDRIAFFCSTPGYYPSTGSQSPLSLVVYRINADSTSTSYNKMERMGKGLLWNGVSPANLPMIFGLQAIVNNWPAATDPSAPDQDYELIAPQIFRFEYFYLLKTGVITDLPGANGMQDVTAIAVTVAAIDPRSRGLLSDSQMSSLIGKLADFQTGAPSYDLKESWQSALNGVTDMPRVAINGIRIYQRYFYLMSSR